MPVNCTVHPKPLHPALAGGKCLLLLSVLSGLMGCHTLPKQNSPPTLDAATRSHLGRIALVWEDDGRRFEYDAPTSKEEQAGQILKASAAGPAVAGTILLGSLEGTRTVEDVALLAAIASAAGIVVAAPATVHNAIIGVRSEAEPRLRPARTAMEHATREVQFGEELRHRLDRCVSDRTSFRVALESLPKLDPTHERPTLQNLYHPLAVQGYDTVIKMRPQAALEGENRFTLNANVWVSVVDLAHNRELYSHRFSFKSEQRKFSDWARNDAQKFRLALEKCYARLTEDITQQLFLSP